MGYQSSGLDRSHAVQMCSAANQLIADLCAGTAGFRHFSRSFSNKKTEEAAKAGQNMCFMHLIITLQKWNELQEGGRSKYLPRDRINDYKNLRRKLVSRKIRQLRDQFAAHVFKKGESRILQTEELENLIHRATQGDIEGFLKWINGPHDPLSVVSIVEYTRNELMRQFQVTREEIISRSEQLRYSKE